MGEQGRRRVAAKVGSATGMQVSAVIAGSPAESAGIHAGDIMVELDGTRIVTATAVQQLMVEDAIARRIEITLWRGGRPRRRHPAAPRAGPEPTAPTRPRDPIRVLLPARLRFGRTLP